MPRFDATTVVKTGRATSDELLCEAAGLTWLAEADTALGAAAPEAQLFRVSADKSLNYLNNILAKIEAYKLGYQECLRCLAGDSYGKIVEAPLA